MFLVSIILSVAIISIVHIYFRYNRTGRLISKIDGPKRMLLLGNLVQIIQTPEQMFKCLREWNKTYCGNIWKLSAFNFRAVSLCKPEDIEVILSSTRFNEKAEPYHFLLPWLGEGLLTSEGEKWYQRRKMLTPAFHFKILVKFFSTLCEQTEETLKTIDEEVGKEMTNLRPLIKSATLRIICETSMGTTVGEDIQSEKNKYFEGINTLMSCAVHRVTRVWLYSDFLFKFTHVNRTQNAALKIVHNFTNRIITRRKAMRKEHEDKSTESDGVYGGKVKMAMLDLLLEEHEKGNIDDEGIRNEVDTFLFEGHDTVATALTFMIMTFANEPQIQNLVYQELETIFKGSKRPPTIDDLSNMKYLECCIKESLRLYPSVPFISRYASKEVDIGGYTIPSKTMMFIHIYDLHRSPAIYPDPEKFVPERFLPEHAAKRHPYAYLPFSAGPRNCIGQKFAMMELKTLMSGLLRRYLLEPVTRPQDLVFEIGIILKTQNPIYVRFCKRNTYRR